MIRYKMDGGPARRTAIYTYMWTLAQFAAAVVSSFECPTQECRCELDSGDGRINILCDQNRLTAVPAFTPVDNSFNKVIMRGHDITSIPDNAFAGIGFDELDMSENPLTAIGDFAFNGTTSDIKTLILHSDRMLYPIVAINLPTKLTTLSLSNFAIEYLPSGPFQNLNKLENLAIKSSSLRTLEANVFQNQAATLKSLDLEGNSLTGIPGEAISPLSALDTLKLSGQAGGIELAGTPFNETATLTHLDLSLNGLSKVEADVFTGLETALRTLVMDNCNLQDTHLPALKRLTGLRTLKLNNNNIANIPTDLLDGMPGLLELDLQHNRVQRIDREMFQGVGDTLEKLYMEGNQIKSMAADTFAVFAGLRELHLGEQQIGALLRAATFSRQADTLTVLHLKNVGLPAAGMEAVSPLRKLENLVLSDNGMDDPMPEYVFRESAALKSLDLSNNNFRAINQSHLFGLEGSMTGIVLKNNTIARMDECTFHRFPAELDIYTINLDHNPLACDCRLRWLKQKQEAERDPQLDFLLQDWRCVTPRDAQFLDVNLAEFTCSGDDPAPRNCDEIYWQFTTTTTTTTEAPTTASTTSSTARTTRQPTAGPSGLSTPTATGTRTPPSGGMTDSVVDPTDGLLGAASLPLIIGVVAGVVVVLVAVIVAVVLVCRRRRAQAGAAVARKPATFRNGGVPSTGYDSKRFTRAPPPSIAEIQGQNAANAAAEGAVGGVEKQPYPGRATSGCTVSTISNGTVHPRYVGDPTVPEPYLYPASVRSGDSYDAYELNEYDEIPADGHYDEIHGGPRRPQSEYPGQYSINHPYDLPDSPGVAGTTPIRVEPPPLPDPRHQYSTLDPQSAANQGFAVDHGHSQPEQGTKTLPPAQQTRPQPAPRSRTLPAGQANRGFVGDYGQTGLPPSPPASQQPPPLPPGNVNGGFEGDYPSRGPVIPAPVQPSPRSSPSRHRAQPEAASPYHVSDVTVNIPTLSPGEKAVEGYDPAKDQYIHTHREGTPV